MENRIHYIHIIEVDIKANQGYIRRKEETINRFRGGTSSDFAKQNCKKLKSEIEELREKIATQLVEIEEIKRGEHDEKFHLIAESSKNKIRVKKSDKQKKIDKQKNRALDKSHWTEKNANRRANYEIQKTERFFHKLNDVIIPDYLKNNLCKMPNNRGYIFKGMRLYGRKPCERDRKGRLKPDVLNERINKDLLRIRESDSREIRIYEKRGNGKRILIQRITKGLRQSSSVKKIKIKKLKKII